MHDLFWFLLCCVMAVLLYNCILTEIRSARFYRGQDRLRRREEELMEQQYQRLAAEDEGSGEA